MIVQKYAQLNRAAARAAWENAIEASKEHLRKHAILEVKAACSGWIDTGLDLAAGDEASLFSAGMVWLSEELGIGVKADVALWHRIGNEGTIAKSVGVTTTFRADWDGRLMLAIKPPGEWLDITGTFDPKYPRTGAAGSFTVAALVWRGTAKEGLTRLRASDASGMAACEIARLDARKSPLPLGWRHMWQAGETEIFGTGPAGPGPARICCRTEHNAGILQFPVKIPLDRGTRLAWAWRVDELPSRLREDSLRTHDYLSIAVEFDNGRDLAYMWSAALPEGKVFPCPLPWWDKRQTHQIVRSDLAKLGQWLEEEQPIGDDYERAIGGDLPASITAIWLIAASAFQKGRGECCYARIRLVGQEGEVFIGPA
ncbi:MAG: DUF3047 domain-containing protein [Beijerinckiaceae bacterium]|nr:DUF3047 domain-containing protein [Beijerinckiaceae bacterium]